VPNKKGRHAIATAPPVTVRLKPDSTDGPAKAGHYVL